VPMRVDEHSWIVGLCAVYGDDEPTVLTERGARDWAASLNGKYRWIEIDPTPRPLRWPWPLRRRGV
jgi:hypothetical protein